MTYLTSLPSTRQSTHAACRAARLFVAAFAATLLLFGCVTESKPRGPRHAQPAAARASTLFPSVRFFEDTDGDGYFDTTEVTVYIFSNTYPEASILVPGEFVFHLKGANGKELRTWRFDQAACDKSLRRLPVGPGFIFRLSLLEGTGGDKLDDTAGELTTEFVPAEGDPVNSVATAVRIGRTGRI
ncbi:MAG: hypothetical protein WC718_16660 [Phycisphaerales bacterium]